MLRKIRIALAAIVFVLITALFLDYTGTLHHWLGWLAKIQFLPALLSLNVGVVVALVLLTLLFGRVYCSVICPLGIFQDIISWFRVHIDTDKCNGCHLCERSCKAACIDAANHTVDYSRCVTCGNCIDKCRRHAISYTHMPLREPAADTPKESAEPVDTSRRSFLVGAAIATSAAALAQEKKKIDGGLAVIKDKVAPKRLTPITPPGSLSAKNVAKHCTACQLCVSACPNDVLRPSQDVLTLMQPVMSYERGYCRPECTRCSEVCPAGAIRPITREDKSATQIGHAVWVRKNCVPLTDGVECGNCARHCPSGAITMVHIDGCAHAVPSVNTERCIGCGACENLCPARPFSAIYVEGNEVHRTI